MKKIITLTIVSCLLFITGCDFLSKNGGSDSSGTNSTVLTVPGGDITGNLAITLSGLPNVKRSVQTRAAGDWSGTIEITGDGITGTFRSPLYRDAIGNGVIDLMLPVGSKNLSIEILYERLDGTVDQYLGSATTGIWQGATTSILVHMEQTISGGTLDISTTNQRYIYVTLIDDASGTLITGATLEFSLNGNVVKTVAIAGAAQQVYIPVQGEYVEDVATPYTYTITHPSYGTLTGSMAVTMNQFVIDGTLIENDYEYANFTRLLTSGGGDVTPPVLSNIASPTSVNEGTTSFGITAEATDNVAVDRVEVSVNGTTVTMTDTGPNYGATVQTEWLNSGQNIVTIIAYDTSGNTDTFSFTIEKIGSAPSATLLNDPVGSIYVRSNELIFNDSGYGIAVWQQEISDNQIYASNYTPGIGWSPHVKLTDLPRAWSFGDIKIDMNSSGQAVIICSKDTVVGEQTKLFAIFYDPSTGWSNVEQIEETYYTDVNLDDNGNAVVIGKKYDGVFHSIFALNYTPGAGWSSMQYIENNNGHTTNYKLAGNSAGVVAAMWTQDNQNGGYDVWTNRYVPGSGWGTAEIIDDGNISDYSNSIDINVNESGVITAVWYKRNGSIDSYNLKLRKYVPGSGWGIIETSEVLNNSISFGEASFNEGGDAIVVLGDNQAGAVYSLFSIYFDTNNGWGTIQPLENDDINNHAGAKIVLNDSGTAFATWSTGNNNTMVINTFTPGIGWGTHRLARPNDFITTNPNIALDHTGAAHLIWRSQNGSGTNRSVYTAPFE